MASMLGGNLKAPKKKQSPPSLLVAIKPRPPGGDAPPPDESSAGDMPMPKIPKPKSPMDMAAHEAAEPPAQESDETYGAKFVNDMIGPLVSAGMDEATAKKTLAAQLRAGADCLDGSDGEDSGLDGVMAGGTGDGEAA